MTDIPEATDTPVAAEKAATETESERKARLMKTGIGIGIGSAAIAAALLFVNRSNRKKKIEREEG